MKRSTVLSAVLVWVVVVAAAAGLTWAVIDAAGRNVLSAGDDSTVQSAPVPASSDTAAPTGEPPTSPTARPSRSPGNDASGSPKGEKVVHTRTWHGQAGSVVVRCQGPASQLLSATPGNGYRAEVESSAGGEIEVQFEGPAQEVRVDASCVGGVPRFAVEVRNED